MPKGRRTRIPNEKAILRQAAEAKKTFPKTTWRELAQRYGVTTDWLRRRIDPNYTRPFAYRQAAVIRVEAQPISDADLKRRRASTPPDDRDFTARLMGDPPFWRSALSKKLEGADA